ncbi:hypothetical protein HRbin40_00945 [bacterium HR40]|nr:hypothetical protein HRbin40_00945 [bacterium HR40]
MEFVAHRVPPDRQEIQSYRPGGFTVSGIRFAGSLLLTAERVWPTPVTHIHEVELAHLAPLFDTATGTDLLIFGTGAVFVLPSAALLGELRRRGIAVESMATAAACRTFNLLVSEERRVAALLVALPG